MRWRFVIVIAVVIDFFVSTAAKAEEPCPVLTTLRAMSADHFKRQRGKALDDDQKSFATDFRIPGADECTIGIEGEKYSTLGCSWYLQSGIDAEPKAKGQFLDTVKAYQGCVKDRDGVDFRKHRDGLGGYVDLTDRFEGQRAGSDYSVSIRYYWSPPWWKLYVEYFRSDP